MLGAANDRVAGSLFAFGDVAAAISRDATDLWAALFELPTTFPVCLAIAQASA